MLKNLRRLCAGGFAVFGVVAAAAGVAACLHSAPAGRVATFTTTVLADELRGQGLSVVSGGRLGRDAFPFFSVRARRLIVAGDDVQVFEFANVELAVREASTISPAGSPIGTSQITWLAPPRFFRKDNLIVLYVGTRSDVARALETAVGKPIIGRPEG